MCCSLKESHIYREMHCMNIYTHAHVNQYILMKDAYLVPVCVAPRLFWHSEEMRASCHGGCRLVHAKDRENAQRAHTGASGESNWGESRTTLSYFEKSVFDIIIFITYFILFYFIILLISTYDIKNVYTRQIIHVYNHNTTTSFNKRRVKNNIFITRP